MDQAGADHLQPFAVEFHIHLDGRFGEREKARSKSYFRLFTEKFSGECFYCALKVGYGNIFIDIKSFELEKLGFVSSIRRFISENFSRRDYPNRRIMLFHIADLNWTCMSPKQQPVFFFSGCWLLFVGCWWL